VVCVDWVDFFTLFPLLTGICFCAPVPAQRCAGEGQLVSQSHQPWRDAGRAGPGCQLSTWATVGWWAELAPRPRARAAPSCGQRTAQRRTFTGPAPAPRPRSSGTKMARPRLARERSSPGYSFRMSSVSESIRCFSQLISSTASKPGAMTDSAESGAQRPGPADLCLCTERHKQEIVSCAPGSTGR
jgi:hypothetical protein